MSNNIKTKELKTTGVATFGEGVTGKYADRLFKVLPGHDAEYAWSRRRYC